MGDQIQQIQRLHLAGTLASGIAHDLNNQLTVLLGNIELAMAQLPACHEAVESIERARTAAGHCACMSQRLLNLGRQARPTTARVDIAFAIKEARQMLQCVKPAGVRISTYIETGLFVKADPTQLQQVLLNLGTNAFHAMPRGGELHIRVWNDGQVRISVRDTGCGIPVDLLQRVFEPFSTTRGESGGTGLGLATVQTIVEGLGGSLSLESCLGEGSTFFLALPLA